MTLQRALICLDCEWVDEQTICPKCGSEHIFPLATWLDPQPELLRLRLLRQYGGELEVTTEGRA